MDKVSLVAVDSKNKVRLVELYWEVIPEGYCIKKETGVLNGKMILQPVHNITSGKVKRTVEQQRDLEFNSMLKKYLDKGYKRLDSLGLSENYSETDIIAVIGSATDAKGAPKPMLCKKYEDVKASELDKDWWISRKFDGVRCAIYQYDGELHSSSRGGNNYDIACKYIFEDSYIKKIFEVYPEIILDAELYFHTWPLQKISGLCRLEETHDDHQKLYLSCYDIMDESKTVEERLEILKSIKDLCKDSDKIQIVDHYKVSGLDNMMVYHNQFISEGYEGAVIRKAKSMYKFGSRSSNWLKIKQFQDAEFEILGLVEGLRDEDFVFQMKTDDGKVFEAKPVGTRAQRQEYRDNISELIGKKGTVKYFGFTPDGLPNLPIFKSIFYGN